MPVFEALLALLRFEPGDLFNMLEKGIEIASMMFEQSNKCRRQRMVCRDRHELGVVEFAFKPFRESIAAPELGAELDVLLAHRIEHARLGGALAVIGQILAI